MSIIEINPKGVGDNMIGILSQIGWIGDRPGVSTPEPLINMEKIFIDVDANGGNGGGVFIWEAFSHWVSGDALLHLKIPHRLPVVNKVVDFLGE